MQLFFFLFREWFFGFLLLAISLIFDALDGSMARTYNLVSEKGELKDTISDRASEFVLFMALGLNNTVSWTLIILSYHAIILITLLRKRAKIDLGFKRIMLFLGIFIDFNIVFIIIFAVNLFCFILQLITIDYKTDKSKQI